MGFRGEHIGKIGPIDRDGGVAPGDLVEHDVALTAQKLRRNTRDDRDEDLVIEAAREGDDTIRERAAQLEGLVTAICK